MSSFVLLLIGSLPAVRAAHGTPGSEIPLAGQALRRWTEQEVSRLRRALGRAAVCCVLGLVLVVGALALAWVTTEAGPTHLVGLRTDTGVVCGELVGVDRRNVTVRAEAGNVVTAPQSTVVSVRPASSCGARP